MSETIIGHDIVVSDTGIALPAKGTSYRISRTAPDELLRHDISDDELEAFGAMKRTHLYDFMWCMLGAAIGAAPSAIEHVYAYASASTPLSGKAVTEIVLTCVTLAIFAVLFFAVYSERKSVPDLISEIRKRGKQGVS